MKDFLIGFTVIPAIIALIGLYAWSYWPNLPGPFFTTGLVAFGAIALLAISIIAALA